MPKCGADDKDEMTGVTGTDAGAPIAVAVPVDTLMKR